MGIYAHFTISGANQKYIVPERSNNVIEALRCMNVLRTLLLLANVDTILTRSRRCIHVLITKLTGNINYI